MDSGKILKEESSNLTYLHHDFEKFWEVLLVTQSVLSPVTKKETHKFETRIRCGKLEPGFKEDPSTIQTVEKKHNSKGNNIHI